MSTFLSRYLTTHQQGLVLHTVGWGIAVASVLLTWATVNCYMGTTALIKAQNAYFVGNINDGVLHGQDALSWLGQQPGVVELAINWNDPQAGNTISALTADFSTPQKAALEPFMAIFQRVHHNDNSISLSGANAALLVCADKCKKGTYTALPPVTRDDPPHHVVLVYTLQQQFMRAWENKNREHIWRASSALRLLAPAHPQIQLIACISEALAPKTNKEAIEASVKPLLGNTTENLTHLTRTIMALAPENMLALVPLIPAEQRTPNESASLLQGQTITLEQQVKNVATSGTPLPEVLAVMQRCIGEKKYALAKTLAPRIPEAERKTWLVKIALVEQDLTALKQLTTDKQYSPRAYSVSLHKEFIAFHVYSDSGIIPNAPVEVRVGGQNIPHERSERIASLVHVRLSGEKGDVTLTCDGETLFTGTLP
jgi:hypothetical protein